MAKSFGSKPARSPASMGKKSSGGNILSGGASHNGPAHTRNRSVAPINLGKMQKSATPLPLNAQGSTGPASMVNRGSKAGDKGGVSGQPVANVSFRPSTKT